MRFGFLKVSVSRMEKKDRRKVKESGGKSGCSWGEGSLDYCWWKELDRLKKYVGRKISLIFSPIVSLYPHHPLPFSYLLQAITQTVECISFASLWFRKPWNNALEVYILNLCIVFWNLFTYCTVLTHVFPPSHWRSCGLPPAFHHPR